MLLCDLNRRTQKPDPFHCHAFQPRLRLAGPVRDSRPLSRPTTPRSQLEFVRDFLKSDKIKYQTALALQKLEQDLDGEKSIEAIVKKLKSSSDKAILEQFQEVKEMLTKGGRLWDKAYFSETIG
jgi:hypothetical protein